MVAMAQTVPVLMAGLDPSVGALMTMVDCFASYLLGAPEGPRLSLDLGGLHLTLGSLPGGVTGIAIGTIICLTIGTLAGLLNGAIVVYGRIQSIIATLATGAIYIGIALFLRPQPGGKIDDDLNWAMTNSLGDFASTIHIFNDGAAPWFAVFAWIPVPFVLLGLIGLFVWVPFYRSVTGRTIYAIGSAEGAAYMSGLNINRAEIAAFTLGGFFAACGGTFLAIQTSSGNADLPQAGAYTLNSIASVVIGGTSLLGGTGGAIGSVFRRAHPARNLLFLSHLHRAAAATAVRGDHSSGGGKHRCAPRVAGKEYVGAFQVTAISERLPLSRGMIGRPRSQRFSSLRS